MHRIFNPRAGFKIFPRKAQNLHVRKLENYHGRSYFFHVTRIKKHCDQSALLSEGNGEGGGQNPADQYPTRAQTAACDAATLMDHSAKENREIGAEDELAAAPV